MNKPLMIATIVLASSLNAQENLGPRDLGLSPHAIRAIQVRIADTATGACWTNLKDVREYAEEKLRIEKYNVVDELQLAMAPDFWFWVGVGAQRDQSDTCDGSISVSVQTMARVDQFFGRLVLVPEVRVRTHKSA